MFAGPISSDSLESVEYLSPGIGVAAVQFGSSQAALAVAQENAQGFTDRMLSMPVERMWVTMRLVVAHSAMSFVCAMTTLNAAFLIGLRAHAPALHWLGATRMLLLYEVAFASLFIALSSVVSSPESAQSLAFIAVALTPISSLASSQSICR